ncbi:glycerol-3-phosphate responsive antiterminator [Jeotgalibacillus proteolyticus]|uniref:Glycerol uptake operon antiterminator regulatory protein n=1 Tax=Jeotgalibacillus proteolyticus TaxID=2082395 RepID=A0A2S5GG30_9BACL|nr:glycerol-3-phosphate responsive antiterminator [Jeotgalibacillus proteolyticus]PPA71982.1 glycerol-3-phosphate responsive antiterminator GlpP [Jeotgalibacillus proteolyticus]
MAFNDQQLLPAIRSMKDFDKLLNYNYRYGVFLDLHISMLKSVYEYARSEGREMFLHMDLIHGLANDEHATEYICQTIKPYGIISTRSKVIQKARQLKVQAIQRTFVIDSNALDRSIQLIQKTDPDYIELLPGVVPKVIERVSEKTGKPIIAGGLIDTPEEVEAALSAGANAITTSSHILWKHFSVNK